MSHYEGHVADQFSRRAARSGDRHVANFVTRQTARRFRSPDLGKITEALGQFGADYRDQFMTRVANTRAHASWDNIMHARHTIVHSRQPAQMTLRELESTCASSHAVLEALRVTLGLTA